MTLDHLPAGLEEEAEDQFPDDWDEEEAKAAAWQETEESRLNTDKVCVCVRV